MLIKRSFLIICAYLDIWSIILGRIIWLRNLLRLLNYNRLRRNIRLIYNNCFWLWIWNNWIINWLWYIWSITSSSSYNKNSNSNSNNYWSSNPPKYIPKIRWSIRSWISLKIISSSRIALIIVISCWISFLINWAYIIISTKTSSLSIICTLI